MEKKITVWKNWKVPGTIFASPVGVKDRLYISSQSGITYVIKQGPTFEILAKNVLGRW